MLYNIAIDETGKGTATMVFEGTFVTVDDSHPNFPRIIAALTNGDPVDHLISLSGAAKRVLGDRVEVRHGVVYFEGEPVHDNLARAIVRYSTEERDATGLIRFMERLHRNPSRRSREQLFDWAQAKDLTIDAEGYLVGYKGVQADFTSVNAGFAVVDGAEVEGHVPNQVGSIIEIPRDQVQDDPDIGCSHGLHVGNYSYARGWGSLLLEVRIDPADVVSVPRDSSFQKLRCCRYEVLAVHDAEVEDDLSGYEPESEAPDAEEAVDTHVAPLVPESFFAKLRRRLFES